MLRNVKFELIKYADTNLYTLNQTVAQQNVIYVMNLVSLPRLGSYAIKF